MAGANKSNIGDLFLLANSADEINTIAKMIPDR